MEEQTPEIKELPTDLSAEIIKELNETKAANEQLARKMAEYETLIKTLKEENYKMVLNAKAVTPPPVQVSHGQPDMRDIISRVFNK